jgi:hypothetical protein
MILQIFFREALRKIYPAITNIIIQLTGDKKNDKTEEAKWCIILYSLFEQFTKNKRKKNYHGKSNIRVILFKKNGSFNNNVYGACSHYKKNRSSCGNRTTLYDCLI